MQVTWLEASAGSGKTTFLISQLQKQKDFSHVMFLTFSNAAAAEIKQRVGKEIKALTIHSLAYEIILNKFPIKNITENSFEQIAIIKLLENDEFKNLLRWLLKVCDAKIEKTQVNEKPIIFESSAPIFVQEFEVLEKNELIELDKLNILKNYFFTKAGTKRKKFLIKLNDKTTAWAIERILEHENYFNKYISWVKNKLYKIIKQKEEEIKQENEVLYYDDLIQIAKDILKSSQGSDIVFKYFGNIKLLLIDEAQDLSQAQWELLNLVFEEWKCLENELIVASDIKQLIYEFQGANKNIFNYYKNKIKLHSIKFEIKTLATTWRLPKRICEFVNNVLQKTDLDFVEHKTNNSQDGSVMHLKINCMNEILKHIIEQKNTMIIFKQKTKRTQNFAQHLFKNGYIINSPYVMEHPVIKDFQHLIRWILFDDQLSQAVIANIVDITNLNLKHSINNLEELCFKWISIIEVQEFFKNKLNKQTSFWMNILILYAQYYKYEAYSAMIDKNNFYKSHQEYFKEGIFFNTIHSAKGKEADNVILCESDFKSKFKNDTHELLYVAITRSKQNLIITTQNEEYENTWAEILLDSIN